jgi:membrane protease YdiL (CAAX protease family)
MNNPYSFQIQHLAPLLAILCVTIGFSTFWFHSNARSVREYFFLQFGKEPAWIMLVGYQKLSGFVLLGLVPAVIMLAWGGYAPSDLGLGFANATTSLYWIVPMSAIIIAMNFFASRQPEGLSNYPQMRVQEWTTSLIAINSLSWAAYLIAYEFLFRGILLKVCYDSFGFWPAVAINLSLYATTHIPKGARETFGTLIYGLVLCYVTIETGSIAVAFVTHLVMALSNDYFSVFHSPKMTFAIKNKHVNAQI